MIRKFMIAAAVVAAMTASYAADAEEDIETQGVGAVGWTPVQVGLFAPVSLPWGFDWDVKGLEFDIFYAETVQMQGLSLCGIATRTRDEMRGVSLAGLCNWNEKEVYGINTTLGVNLGFEDVYGIQIGAFSMRKDMKGVDINLVGSHSINYYGVQIGGICNFTLEESKGVDVALGLNMTKELTGAQLGGINFTHKLTGTQIGFFNIAEECPCGIQLGLVNIIMDNKVKVLPITNFYF